MKTTLRTALTVTMASGLFLTASGCSSSPGNETPAQGPTATATADIKEPVNSPVGGEKNATFSSQLNAPLTVPAQWQGGSGWFQESRGQLAALPNHIVHVIKPAVGVTDAPNTGLRIYDNNGDAVVSITPPAELVGGPRGANGVANQGLLSSWEDGKLFLSYLQVGVAADGRVLWILTSFDENANQLSRNVIEGTLKTTFINDAGAIVVSNVTGETDKHILDVHTGKIAPLPSGGAGEQWVGRLEGVDVFKSEKGLRSANWSLPFQNFATDGRYVFVADANGACEVYDPRSGERIEGNNGGCVPAGTSDDEKFTPVTPVNAIVLEKKNGAHTVPVLFLPTEKKSVTVDKSTFRTVSVAPDGTFYGAGENGTVWSVNPKTDTEPKVVEGAQAAPLVITNNGMAAFKANGENPDLYNGSLFFVIPKK